MRKTKIMAEEKLNFVMEDLQKHLANANVNVSNLSSIAKNGDEKLVEKFMSEAVFVKNPSENRVELAEKKEGILQSQLYVACFWGFRDIVRGLLSIANEEGIDLDLNAPNKDTLWTPLHAATFQEHGPIVMQLLQTGADPVQRDAEGRSAADFASASDKVWPHFQGCGLHRTPKSALVQMGILRKGLGEDSQEKSTSRRGYSVAAYQNPDYEELNDPHSGAARGGDVLANDESDSQKVDQQPQFKIYK